MIRKSIVALISLASIAYVACSSDWTSTMPGTSSSGGASGTSSGDDSGAAAADASTDDTGVDSGGSSSPPPAPTMGALSEANGSGKGLKVAWSDTATDLTGYDLQRNSNGGTFSSITAPAGTDTSYFDSSATGMKTYCYKIKAIRGTDDSSFSPETCLMTGM